jgi:hypothetical protein
MKLDVLRIKQFHHIFHNTVLAAIIIATMEKLPKAMLRSGLSLFRCKLLLDGVQDFIFKNLPNNTSPRTTIR